MQRSLIMKRALVIWKLQQYHHQVTPLNTSMVKAITRFLQGREQVSMVM
jgi:hypothetical protein